MAQEPGSTKLSLKECIRIGIANSFDLRNSYATSQLAAADLTQAFGAYLPSADITANYNRQLTNLRDQISFINGVPIFGAPLPNNYSLNGTLNLTLFNGFRREAQYDAAQSNVDATTADVAYFRLFTAYDVTRKYIDVLRKQQILNARRENLALSQATFERIKALKDGGRSTIQQVMSQETELANQEVGVVQAQNDVDNAKAQLLSSMSTNPSQSIDIDETVIAPEMTMQASDDFRKKIGPETVSVQRAFETRPDILAAKKRVSAAESGITTATAGYWPTLTATGGYSWRNSSVSNFDSQGQMYVGLFLRIPVFDQFITNRAIQNATTSFTRQSMDQMKLENQIRTNIRSAYLQLIAAEKGLDITERAIKSATTNFNAVQERFNVGSATLLDVQTANNQLITARVNRVSAVYSYYEAAAYVEFTTGTFGEN